MRQHRNNVSRLLEHYCCSRCWRHLVERFDRSDINFSFVVCVKCGDETVGYITRGSRDHLRDQDAQRYYEVRRVLINTGIIPNPNAGKTPEELLKELGQGDKNAN